ncbi:MAG TPA: hypothetical protein VGM05_29375 [Planctomycetaceae bacterium]|jgi:hypothetical protein
MNCDTAFDLMTEPHGSRSGALAQHFDSCPRCRRMQEALSPALDFLVEGNEFGSTGDRSHATSGAYPAHEPFVTTETVQIARQASAHLAALGEMPRAQVARLTARAAKYAAAFAAGLLLAVVLFSQRDGSTPAADAACTRREAWRDDASRTTDQIQALVHSCAVCHSASPAGNDQSTINPAGHRSWDWLVPLLEQKNQQPVDDAVGLPTGPMIAAREEPFRMYAGDA